MSSDSRSSLDQTTVCQGQDSLEGGLAAAFGPPFAAASSPGLDGKPRVPGYRVDRLLGRGSYGEVWLAREEGTGVEVAIKFFAHGTGLEWQLLLAEVKQLALLQADPGIVQLKDVEPAAEPPYFIMAYADNGCLAKKLASGPLPLRQALPIFRQVTATLAYVHAKGIRHCDLKPGNILLDVRERALVADFGQAHLSTDATPALGTFFYMAPEQAQMEKQIPDTRWDVYGLGALFYAMLVGAPPREDVTIRDELSRTATLADRLDCYRRLVTEQPPPHAHRRVAGMDPRLAEIIDRCLEVDPAKRLHNAGAVLDALARRDRHLRQRPIRLFALVLPLLLLLVMIAVIGRIIAPFQTQVVDAQEEAVRHARQRNEYLARILATDVREQLEKRIRILEQISRDEALPGLLKAGQNEDLFELLSRQQLKWPMEVGGLNEDLSLFTFLWITDRRGNVHAICPRNAELPMKNYAYRDWFHGLGDDRTPGNSFDPVARTYLCQPYVSTVKGQPVMIAVSTPIRGPDGKEVIGLVSGSIELRTFHGWFHQLNLGHSQAILLNQHGRYLFHPDVGRIKPTPGQPPAEFPRDTDIFRRLVVERGFGSSAGAFEDPIDGKTYRASYAADPVLGWGVIIQEQAKSKTEHLLEELNRALITAGLVGLGVYTIVVPGLWLWLRWMLRKEELPV